MPRVPPLYPAPGTSPVADAIRQRRGARGLSPLDGTLLQSPAYASGWNQLLGAVRTKTTQHLPADVREIIILRVAVRNRAAFEWIQHEIVARQEGNVNDECLTAVRSVGIAPSLGPAQYDQLVPPQGPLTPLQAMAVIFTDESTLNVDVLDDTFAKLRQLLLEEGKTRAGGDEAIRQLLLADAGGESAFADRAVTEAVATVATYNMVSRFLVALDVDGRSQQPVPWPAPHLAQSNPNSSALPPVNRQGSGAVASRNVFRTPDGNLLSTLFHAKEGDSATEAPTVICINSLMTDLSMWTYVLPALRKHFNVITYDQRGHGHSSIPREPCTLSQLADDTALVLSAYGIARAHAIIGVSQGGATALTFLMRHPDRAAKFVVCDTQAIPPLANVKAWDERIALVKGANSMAPLAEATLPRWYSSLFDDGPGGTHPDQPPPGSADPRRAEILNHTGSMIRNTPIEGFVAGARSLQGYDLLSPPASVAPKGLLPTLAETQSPVLLVAGAHDGALPTALQGLADDAKAADASQVEFVQVERAGHLPMIDQPQAWTNLVLPFLLPAVP
ncbi:hypothetical protein OC861_003259 [Tilletia horrida]|nr:hypothetical protein OC861_003259 [Tilletia horrida]